MWKGKGHWEEETGKMALGEMGERRREGEERWKDRRKYWDEKERGEPHWRNDKLDASFRQTKLFICSSFSSSSLNVDILRLSCPGSPALCFLSVFDKGDHGGWSSVDPGASRSLMEECCCLLLRTPSQLETHLWAFLSSLPARSKQPPPLLSISTFPRSIPQTHTPSAEQKKNKVCLTFPECTISLSRAASRRCTMSSM